MLCPLKLTELLRLCPPPQKKIGGNIFHDNHDIKYEYNDVRKYTAAMD